MIQLKHIGVKYDDWVLRDINLAIEVGSITGVIGKSGIGKTTFIKTIAGLIDVEEGEVLFKGERLIGPSLKLIPGYDSIQLVNQDFGLEPYHTVEQNIKEKILHLHKSDQTELVTELLDLVELDSIRERKAHLLSGGEQQRLAIARALASEPEVLLLDEPFVHLDQRMRLKIIEYIITLHELRNLTVLIISHDGAELIGFVDEVIHLDAGKVKRIAKAKEMYYYPDSKGQGELLGSINEIRLEEDTVLFRPNEYELSSNEGIEVSFSHAIDTGLLVYNYFELQNEEKIMLTAMEELNDVEMIKIVRRG